MEIRPMKSDSTLRLRRTAGFRRGWTSPFFRGTWKSSFQRQSVLYLVCDLKGFFELAEEPACDAHGPPRWRLAKGSEEPAAASRGIASSRRADGVAPMASRRWRGGGVGA